MITIFKKNKKAKANKIVYDSLKVAVEKYRVELDNYSDTVTETILLELAKQGKYHLTGNLEDEIGKLLANPPQLGDLSLPAFLEETDRDGHKYEVVNLKYGYLFIYLNENSYDCRVHVSKDTAVNPYLDIRASFKQTLPNIVRKGTLASDNIFMITRLAKLFIK